jgi:hypothetical protein
MLKNSDKKSLDAISLNFIIMRHTQRLLCGAYMQRVPEFFFCCKEQFYVQPVAKLDELCFQFLKGQSNEIFDSCFFIKQLILIPTDMPRSDIEFRRIFVDLFVLEIPKNRLPLMRTKRKHLYNVHYQHFKRRIKMRTQSLRTIRTLDHYFRLNSL